MCLAPSQAVGNLNIPAPQQTLSITLVLPPPACQLVIRLGVCGSVCLLSRLNARGGQSFPASHGQMSRCHIHSRHRMSE